MKKIFIVSALIFLLTGCKGMVTVRQKTPTISEARIVSGVITKDTTFSGLIRVAGDLYVPKGVTLTILPGTKLIIEKSDSTKIEPIFLSQNTEILIKGDIIARGNPDRKIIFQSDRETPGNADYAGIILYESKGSYIQDCVFQNAHTGVLAIKSVLNIDSCEFEDCFYAVSASGCKIDIKSSSVKNCEKGFYFNKSSVGILSGSEFTGCAEDGVFISKDSSINMFNNTFKDNLWGVSTTGYAPGIISGNKFENNKENVLRLNYD